MVFRFQKMNGAGNDFVVVDNRGGGVRATPRIVRALCDRKRGVGADGVILVETEPHADYRMRYFNSDGGEAEMCGNGARCAALFASKLGLGGPEGEGIRLRFRAQPGLMTALVQGGRVAVSMTDAVGLRTNLSLALSGGREIVHFVNTGVPHAVVVTDDWDSLTEERVVKHGREIRLHQEFSPDGANANFVRVGSGGVVSIRTYERGVESETLACGTGSIAAAVILSHLRLVESPVSVMTRGNELLRISFRKTTVGATDVVLEGPADVNFDGVMEVSDKE